MRCAGRAPTCRARPSSRWRTRRRAVVRRAPGTAPSPRRRHHRRGRRRRRPRRLPSPPTLRPAPNPPCDRSTTSAPDDAHSCPLRITRHDRDDARAERGPELHRSETGAAPGSEHEQPLAGLQRTPSHEPDEGRRVADPKRSGILVTHVVGHAEGILRPSDRRFGEPAATVEEVRHRHEPCAEGQVDSRAHGVDRAAHLLTRDEGERRGERVRAAAHERVREPDPRRAHAQPQLTRARNRLVNDDTPERVAGWAVPLDLPGVHATP